MSTRLKDRRKSIEIFKVLFKVGFFTFGGGWSIIAQMEKEFIENRQWITEEKLLELISVAKSLPGIMIVNLAVMFGYSIAGIIGAVAASLAIVLPSIITLTIVTAIYEYIIDNVYVAKAMVGVRAAVIPIIISAVIKLKKAAIFDKTTLAIAICAAAACLLTDINNFIVVIAGGIIGIAIKVVVRRENQKYAA